MSGDKNKVLTLIRDLQQNTDKKIKELEASSEKKILSAVEKFQSDIERKIDHKINNIKMDIVGLQAQHEHLDAMLGDLKVDIKSMTASMSKMNGNQQAINESLKHFSDTIKWIIKWILGIGGTLFLSLLSFVLYKGL